MYDCLQRRRACMIACRGEGHVLVLAEEKGMYNCLQRREGHV